MFTALNQAVSAVNDVLWSYVLIIMLVGCGLWFTFKMKFTQLTMLPEMIRLMGEGVGTKTEGNQISSFQAFCVSTASRVGVGNIAGIAIAVVSGGPGAVFWMWVISIIGSATGFVESTLAQIYKLPRENGGFHGGPAYYIKNALGSSWASMLFAVLISVTYGLIFNSVQANTIALSLETAFGLDRTMVGAAVAVLSGLVIFGGVSRIARLSEWLVPIMAGIYILTALLITLVNIDKLPGLLVLIVSNAFTPDAVFGGGFAAAIMTGIKRGLFSNEAGMGSVPNAAATAIASHPVKQGLIQAFGVFVDTLLVCTSSAFLVLVIGDYTSTGLTGIALVQYNLGQYLGSWAPSALAILVFMFAFSSIVGNYYYGEINIPFIHGSKTTLHIFRICVAAMVFFGSIAELSLVWNLADLFMALMAITNLIAITFLAKYAYIALADYKKQKAQGIEEPVFKASVMPNTKGIYFWKD